MTATAVSAAVIAACAAILEGVPRALPGWSLRHIPVLYVQRIAAARTPGWEFSEYCWSDPQGMRLVAELVRDKDIDSELAVNCFMHLTSDPVEGTWPSLVYWWEHWQGDAAGHARCLDAIAHSKSAERLNLMFGVLRQPCHADCEYVAESAFIDPKSEECERFLVARVGRGEDVELCKRLLKARASSR